GAIIGACWHDGAVQAYDAISQSDSTTIGDQYTLYLLLAEDDNTNFAHNGTGNGFTDFSRVSTNGQPGQGGNGIDVLAYALPGQDNIPSPVPEPASWVLVGGGLLLFGLAGRRYLA
ncbi:MAG: PEP-CTERM sorting domain-containing protein, partial [Terriglobales bacterium]